MKSLLLRTSLVIAALGATACSPKKQDDKPPMPKVAATPAALPKLGAAPAWKLTDLTGKAVSSDEFKGKVVVVDFWATWCGPCRAEIPGYVAMQEKFGRDLVIVGVSLDQAGPEIVKSFAEKFRINYPIVMGDENVLTAFGGVQAIPTTFLIDRQGQIRDRKEGAEPSAEYEQKVGAIVAEKA